MMEKLAARAEQLARLARERQLLAIARRLRSSFRDGAVEVGEGRVTVGGEGIVKRWLIDPSLRFFSRGFE
jgi:hypothetical protein